MIKKYAKYLTLVLCAYFAYSLCVAQPEIYRKEYLQVKDGLSDNRVSCVFQDSKGLLWFGTQKGLNQYNAYSFKNYHSMQLDSNTLSDNDITAITEDGDKNIWVGTFGTGINKFDRKTRKFTRFLKSDFHENSVISSTVWDMKYDGKDNIWIATDAGISKYEISNNSFVNFSVKDSSINGLKMQTIYCLTQDNKGRMWFGGSNSHLHLYDENENKFVTLPTDFIGDEISALFADSKGVIWIGTENGYFGRFNTNTQRFSYIEDRQGKPKRIAYQIWCISEDDKGNLWIGAWGTLALINKKDLSVKYYDQHSSVDSRINKVQSNVYSDILQDESGVIWLCSRKGLVKLTERYSYHFKHIPGKNSISSNYVTSFAQDSSGIIWIGTDKGLNSFDPETNHFMNYYNTGYGNYELLQNINSLLYGKEHNLWVGCEGVDLSRFDISKRDFTNYGEKYDYSNLVFQIFQSSKDTLWSLSNTNKISYFLTNKKTFDTLAIERDPYVLCMEEDHRGFLWFGTYHNRGLWRYDQDKGKLKKLMHNDFDTNSLCSGTIYDIHRDTENFLWIGTDNGLNKITYVNDDIKIRRYDRINPNNTVYAIKEDNSGRLWLRLMQGIAIFDKKTESFKIFEDVLPSGSGDEWKIFISNDNKLFVAGTNGFVIFNTESKNNYIPPLVLTQFIINKKTRNEYLYSDKVYLDYNENSITCEYAALDYTNPDLNQYSYMMEGVDTDWTFAGNRRYLNYTNLDPGNYILRIKGSNSDDVWNETGLSVQINISPPFWETTWYYLAEILFFGTLLTITIIMNRRSKVKHIAGLSFITILTLLVIFEFINVTLEPYVEGIAGGVPVFKLLLNVLIAVLFFPLEKIFVKTMKKKKISMKKNEIIETILKDDEK